MGRRLLWGALFLLLLALPAGGEEKVLRWAGDSEGGVPFMFNDPKDVKRLIGFEVDIMEAVLEEHLSSCPVRWDRRATAGVVLASGGYPGSYQTGIPIEGLEQNLPDTLVFHAGTRIEEGRVVTAGGRVLTVCAWGDTLEEAVARAYRRADAISFSGMHRRGDIGWRSLYPDSSGEA